LNARREKRAEGAADGDGRESLSVSLERQHDCGKASRNEDQRAQSEVSEIVFHDVIRDLDDRGRSL